ncbi:MAG: MFS transporter, partial [Clostridia bacterium]|nr:MFS transporter [Clostridia bacterium]
KTKTRWGKFRPWLFIGTVLNAVILYVMFSAPPSLTPSGITAYAAVFYILWGTTYTMMDIPYWSMIPAFTEGGKERENLTTLARSCAGVGSALITIVTVIAVQALGAGNERVGFSRFALIIAAVFVLFETIAVLTIREKSTVDMKTSSVGDMFKALIKNDQTMVVVLAIVLVNTAVYITSNLVIYFFKYDVGGATWYNDYTLFNTFGGAISILSMMLLFPFLRRFFTTTRIFYIAAGAGILGYLALIAIAFLTPMSNIYLLLIPGFLIFAANGILTVLVTVFLANTVDYGELQNGTRDESVVFSMQTFVVKLASGIAALAASLTLQINHIQKDGTDADSAAVIIDQAARNGLRISMTVIPIVLLAIAIAIFAKKFILTEEKVAEITEELHERRQGPEEVN